VGGGRRTCERAGRLAALAEAGIDYEYMLFPDEGRGFAKPENRLKFYAAAERFLARYLGGRFEEG
jgi:dipeptidyl aminopeptidase/acylaminoacyl peptidase